MIVLRRILQVVAGIAIVLALLFPPIKYTWITSDRTYEGSLGFYFVTKAPDNPILIVRMARKDIRAKTPNAPVVDTGYGHNFNHTKDSIAAAIDPGQLILELLAITAFAAIGTWVIDKSISARGKA